MPIKSEQLLEALLDLERSRQREYELRIESEALLLGLKGITGSEDQASLFCAMVDDLRLIIEFEDAFILQEKEGQLVPLSSTAARFMVSVWKPQSVFKRAFSGLPIAVFDVEQVPEWSEQPPSVRKDVKSALHIGLRGVGKAALLVLTHRDSRHFGPVDVNRAARFSPLACQALSTLGLRRTVTQRDRFFRLSTDLMGILDSDGRLQQFNGAWTQLLGYESSELDKRPMVLDFLHPSDRGVLADCLRKMEGTRETTLLEIRLRCRDGAERWFSCNLAAYPDEQLFYLVARDITDRVMAERQLAFQASHDFLTGLYNRMAFADHLDRALALKVRWPHYCFAVMYFDFNSFKTINDTYGHNTGNEVLKEFARRLLDSVRKIDTIGRLGGDDFAILLFNLDCPDNVSLIARRIQKSLSEPFRCHSQELTLSISIGIALGTLERRTAKDLLQDAESAMYAARSKGELQYAVFHPKMRRTDGSGREGKIQ